MAKERYGTALYRKVIDVHTGDPVQQRTVRIGAFPAGRRNPKPSVTFGLGYDNPDDFARIYFEVTQANWKEINRAVTAAFKALSNNSSTPQSD